MNNNRLATEKQKLIQEKCLAILTTMLKDEDNKYCVDCDAKGPRWASWNLGVFLCIRCAGIHRNLGVHISKVKSVNLDTWKPEQAVALQQMGNSRARAVYEANLPDNFRRPQTDASLESFIRAKYEHNKYTAREWVPPKPPRVNWDAEIDAMQREHRKGGSRGRVEQPATPVLKKPLPTPTSAATPPPPPSKDSPQQKAEPAAAPAPAPTAAAATDLLGLETPSPTPAGGGAATDVFGDFLSAAPAADPAPAASGADTLAADEANFFSQPSEASGGGAKVMSKDSILALFGQSRPGAGAPPPGGLAGLNMPTATLPAYAAQSQMPAAFPQQQQQQMPAAFPQQQQVPAAFPQQQQVPAAFPQRQQQQVPAAFPQQQQQQMSSAFPQQHQQQMPAAYPSQQLAAGFPQQMPVSFQPMPAGFPQQQPQSMPVAFGGQPGMAGYPQGGFVSQQAAPGVSQQSFSMVYSAPQQTTSQYQPASYQQPLHQQMSGLALGEQQARLVTGAAAFPPMGSAPPLNGQLWQ